MHKTRTTLNCLLDWLLVLGLALAPMQGAFSAPDDTGEHNQKVATEETVHHHSAAIDPACHDPETSPAQDCCKQNSNDGECSGVCNPFQVSAYLLSSSWNITFDNHSLYESQPAVFYIGRSVPALFRPPPVTI